MRVGLTKMEDTCPHCGHKHTIKELDRDAGPFCIKCGTDMDGTSVEESKKVCWLCEGTGFVMKDRQTGSMFGKDPCIDWSKKDHIEYKCPNCDAGVEKE